MRGLIEQAVPTIGHSPKSAVAVPAQGQVPALLMTLGTLKYGTEREIKPLLLLVYLAFAGATARRDLARLLWPETKSPENNLRVALCTLKQWGVPLELNGELCATTVRCDAHTLLQARGLEALHCYPAAFLEGVCLHHVAAEFEDWVYLQRELLATHVQQEVIAVAQACQFLPPSGAALAPIALAEWAWSVAGAPPPEPIMLARLLALSQCQSELYELLVAELADYGWSQRSLNAASGRLLGRETLLLALMAWWLEGSGVAWVIGEAGLGKTALGLELLYLLQLEGQAGLYLDGTAVHDLADLPAYLDQALLEGRRQHGALPPLVLLDNLEHWADAPGGTGALEELLRRQWPELRFVCLTRSAPTVSAQTLALHLQALEPRLKTLTQWMASPLSLRASPCYPCVPLVRVPHSTGAFGSRKHRLTGGSAPSRAPPRVWGWSVKRLSLRYDPHPIYV